jgi:tetratricopeptide (TPR) repeat protein
MTCSTRKCFINLALVLAVGIGALVLYGCGSGNGLTEEEIDLHKQLAGELRDNKLYHAAIEEYSMLLSNPELPRDERANINYLIGRIYYEDLNDYRNAAAHYMRARAMNPEGSFMNEASRNLVASLQKIGNIVDAKRELNQATDIDRQPASDSDRVVARIGEEPVYRSEIERAISRLSPETQKQLLTPEAKSNFVRQYVGRELLYRAATREGYQSDPEIVRQSEELTRQLVVEKFVTDKVMPKINVDTLDVRTYYKAHEDDRYDDQPYDSVKAQVFLDYQQEKAQAAYMDYINTLARTENVVFLDQNWQ